MSTSFVHHLLRQLDRLGDARAFTFLDADGVEHSVLTFAALDAQARAIAAALLQHLRPGDRALLAYPSGPDFIVAFLGCLYAGVIAVPVNTPRKQQGLDKLTGIALNSGAGCILTDATSADSLALRVADVPELSTLPVRAIGLHTTEPALYRVPSFGIDDIAFLQYTSGSTGRPKGVAVTQGNLLANEQMITDAFAHGRDTVVAGWLPFHHDMGLVGNILNPLYVGVPCVLMSPVAFAQQPLRWLNAISTYRATTSGGPNFAYELCIRRITDEEVAALDLRSWTLAFSGAEPVRKDTLDRFARKFATAGFDAKAFYPCYGMAEATLFVSGGEAGQGAAARDGVVVCGHARGDEKVLVVDPEFHHPCDDGEVGEVWVRGTNVAKGYWKNEAMTAQTFGARLASGDGPFLRTGDLGFMAGGDLCITGRRKELIIVRGRKLYAHDVEDKVQLSHPVLDGGGAAAFGLYDEGEEKLVVLHEVAARRLSATEVDAVQRSARAAVARHFDVHLHELVLVRPGGLPRTSSGKMRRGLCRELYAQRALPVLEVRA